MFHASPAWVQAPQPGIVFGAAAHLSARMSAARVVGALVAHVAVVLEIGRVVIRRLVLVLVGRVVVLVNL